MNGESNPAASRPNGWRLLFFIAAIPLVIFIGLASIFMKQLSSGKDASAIPSALIGKPAPAATMPHVAGLKLGQKDVPGFSGDDFAGTISVVNVFASWCVPCRAEHPLLMELSERSGIQIIGINYKDKAENAVRFLGQLGNPYSHVGSDEAGRAVIDWGVYGVPETFLVDGDNTIVFKHVGPLNGAGYANLLTAIGKTSGAN